MHEWKKKGRIRIIQCRWIRWNRKYQLWREALLIKLEVRLIDEGGVSVRVERKSIVEIKKDKGLI